MAATTPLTRALLPTVTLMVTANLWLGAQAPADKTPLKETGYLQWHLRYSSEAPLRQELQKIPEVVLDEFAQLGASPHAALQAAVLKMTEHNRRNVDGFVRDVVLQRPLLAGLPFRLGAEGRLSPAETQDFVCQAPLVRNLLRPEADKQDPAQFWTQLKQHPQSKSPGTVRAACQILPTAHSSFRQPLAHFLADIPGKQTTLALTQLALFDPSAEVREQAGQALKGRPFAGCGPVLLAGLRHPWAPVAHHAGRALISLRAVETVPQLVDLLDEPDPAAPFETKTAAGD